MSHDFTEAMAVIPGLAAKLQTALADRHWTFAEELAAAIQAQAESIRGYAQARMELPAVMLGPERPDRRVD